MRPSVARLGLVWLCLTSACATAGGLPPAAAPGSSGLFLITPAPNASATPTPFQPPGQMAATPASVYSIDIPTLEPFFPTATSLPAERSRVDLISTVDLSSLFPTAAAPPEPANDGEAPPPLPQLTGSETLNFLLIGSDKRAGSSYRTDTLVVVILWPADGQVSMISIPRDLWTYIPGVGMQRINTAYQTGEIYGYAGGGPALLRDTIAYNLGIRIDHTAMVEFDGFRRIVDTLAGVDVPVACPFTDWRLTDPSSDPYIEDNWALFTLEPGIVHMDGDLALWYARSRLRSSDFDRGRRQQEMLRAIFNSALRTDTLARVPQLYVDLSSTLATDLGVGDLIKLAGYAPHLTGANIRSFFIRPPYVTEWTTPAGADVQLPNQTALEQMLVQATTLSTSIVEREKIGVEVQNGTPTAGLDQLAASRLTYAGYTTRVSLADRQDYVSSVLIDLTSAQDPGKRSALIDTLALDTATVVSAPDPAASVQYRIILGRDYEPCFQPEDLTH